MRKLYEWQLYIKGGGGFRNELVFPSNDYQRGTSKAMNHTPSPNPLLEALER